jgi:hypothetical protein
MRTTINHIATASTSLGVLELDADAADTKPTPLKQLARALPPLLTPGEARVLVELKFAGPRRARPAS